MRTAEFRCVVRIPETSGAAEYPSTLLHIATGTTCKDARSSKGAEDIDAGPVNT
jgi:hypothetical protein